MTLDDEKTPWEEPTETITSRNQLSSEQSSLRDFRSMSSRHEEDELHDPLLSNIKAQQSAAEISATQSESTIPPMVHRNPSKTLSDQSAASGSETEL